jgi:zinc/manganese transport system substrate-binding protein
MKKYIMLIIGIMFVSFSRCFAGQISVAASLPDLASIAASIGGEKVTVFAIAKGNTNPHLVEVLPSYMIRVSRAKLYLKCGLSLDQWADAIIDGSRNDKLTIVDCSEGIPVLDKPTGKVDATLGDVHPQGNPHYWLEPSNGIIIAGTICGALKKIDPDNSAYYDANFAKFKKEMEKSIKTWKDNLSSIAGQKIITYHSSWVYFASAFNLTIAANVGPLPGIPPTAKHLAKLINIITSNNIKILLQEPYFPDSDSKFLERQTGIRIYKFAPSCTDVTAEGYVKHFEDIIKQLQGRQP